MNDLVRSIPFVGAKHKLLPQLLPHLNRPQFTRFFDAMCGSGVIGVNVDCDKVLLNDINKPLMSILRTLYEYPAMASVEVIEGLIRDWGLNAEDPLPYNFLRKEYNGDHPDSYILLTLLYHGFNGMMRFSAKKDKKTGADIQKFNVPFGHRTFNPTAKANLIAFITKLQSKTMAFRNLSLGLWDFTNYGPDVLTFLDPPYLISGAAYNTGWGKKQDKLLMDLADSLNDKNAPFAITNVFQNNNHKNEVLIEWAKKYDVVYLDSDFSNSYYTRKKAKTVEVLIKNYE